ncbi:MAG TPA: CopD family protein [Burkholderiaceae bacterium]|nr:CopD family protein [Burkholderiaceae bacterium]
MALLIDIFGFLSVLLRGCALSAQSFTIGGVTFLLLLAQPLAPALGSAADSIVDRTRRLLAWSALALAGIELLTLALQVTVLAGTLAVSPQEAATASFAVAALAIAAGAVTIAVGALRPSSHAKGRILWPAALVVLVAQVATSHAAARIDGRLVLGAVGLVHMAAAAAWIGGLPYLLAALARTADGPLWRLIGRRYSLMSMVSVSLLVGGGVAMAVAYIGSPEALYGTAYGTMVATKTVLLGGLLFLGAMNFRLVRAAGGTRASVLALRRFAEAELGIGVTVLFAAASLTSQPPGIDLTADRASLREVVERITPRWPRLVSPGYDSLGISRLNAQITVATTQHQPTSLAFVPGEGILPPRNAMDIAWSEFNHHWAGLFVLVIGVLALLERAGRAPWARHWPLMLLVLAVPMSVRADPELWPIGKIGLLESLRDPEVVQHRVLECLTALFGILEWRVRTQRTSNARALLVFPLLCALGGAMLLTHSHALTNVKDQLLIEITHEPLAVCVLAAAWSRWIQVRLDGTASRVAGWIWPLAFVATATCLLLYREH